LIALPEEVSIQQFREKVLEGSSFLLEGSLDAFLYDMIPLTPAAYWKDAVINLLSDFELPHLESLLDEYPSTYSEFFGAKQIKELAKTFYILLEEECAFSFDLHEVVAKKAETLGLAPPAPFLFADTNWSQFYFGFVVNPGTMELELWRVEPSGGAAPMISWKKYFDERNLSSWSICSKPFEYRL